MDALTGPTGTTGELAAAKLRRAAAESGIGPGDPLQSLISALADAVGALPDAVQKMEAAGMPLTEYQIGKLAHSLATGSHNAVTRLVTATNRRTVLSYAGGVFALMLVAFGAGVLCGWQYSERQNASLVSWGKAAMLACQSDAIVVDHGQKVCRLPIQ